MIINMTANTLTPEFLAQKTWDLYQTHGVPIEVSEDILEKSGYNLNQALLKELISNHQKMSQDSSKEQFKSGLNADSSKTRAMHTTTHILHQVLRAHFGESVQQKGSAITDEKARFDITLPAEKLNEIVLDQIIQEIQAVIDQNLEMKNNQMSEIEARELGAIGLFGEKYGEVVTVYSLVNPNGVAFSREFCGGPHIENTSQIGTFEFLKKKSIGQGLTRIEFTVKLPN